MARPMLYPDENSQVERHSSINQYNGFFAVLCQGGWSPVVFDQLDGVNCQTVNHHPVVISFTDDIGYHYSDAHCSYASESFIYFDEEGVQEKLLPACYGGGGETYLQYVRKNTFVNFDDDASLGLYNRKDLRVGTDYVLAKETLPAVE